MLLLVNFSFHLKMFQIIYFFVNFEINFNAIFCLCDILQENGNFQKDAQSKRKNPLSYIKSFNIKY